MRRTLAKIALRIAMELDIEVVMETSKRMFEFGEDLRKEVEKEMMFGPITNGSIDYVYQGQSYMVTNPEPDEMERLDIAIHDKRETE